MKPLFALACAATLSLPLPGFAAGDGTVPDTTNPNAQCNAGEVFDRKSKACVPAKSGSLKNEDLLDAVRYYAFAEEYEAALEALHARQGAHTAETLTLLGFVTRKLGDFERALAYYEAALILDPNHWQARSYMGQGFVEKGNSEAARTQLTLIRTTGGRGTWAELSLRHAIESGAGFRY